MNGDIMYFFGRVWGKLVFFCGYVEFESLMDIRSYRGRECKRRKEIG